MKFGLFERPYFSANNSFTNIPMVPLDRAPFKHPIKIIKQRKNEVNINENLILLETKDTVVVNEMKQKETQNANNLK